MRTLPQNCVVIIERWVTGAMTGTEADDLAVAMRALQPQQYADVLCYWDSRRKGTSPMLAEMFALQAAPQPKTDATFLSQFGANGAQFDKGPMAEDMGNRYKKTAEAAGQNTKGKGYLSSLAAYPGDPEAWVSDRHDVQRVIEQRGWTCEGDVNVKTPMRSNDMAGMMKEAPDLPYTGGIDLTEKTDGPQVVLEPAK